MATGVTELEETELEGINETWADVFSCIDELLRNIDVKKDDPNVNFHEAALIFNRIETTLSILLSLTSLDIDLDGNTVFVLDELSESIKELYYYWGTKLAEMRRAMVTLPNLRIENLNTSGHQGRPSFCIPKEILENLRASGYSWTEISKILHVSRWTIYRRVREFNLQDLDRFSHISNDELDKLIRGYISRHGNTTGESYLFGFIRSKGIRVQIFDTGYDLP